MASSNWPAVGGSSPYFGDPVATSGSLPAQGAVGEIRLVLDTDDLYEWNGSSWIKITENTADVAGPASSTDNQVVRFDGTSGKTIQTSAVVIDDSGNVTGVNDMTVAGDLTVNGTTTTFNTETLDVEDANITVNVGGTQATANTGVAGLTVEMSDATDCRIGFDSTATSKFKCGVQGSEVEIATISAAQTITNKTIDADSNTITNIENADIKAAAAIDVSKLAALTASRAVVSDGSGFLTASAATATEVGHLSGVTSAIQTQIDSKQATITGAATSIVSSNLTVSRAVVSNGSGKVAVSTATATEVGHLSGVTSAIQTQLNAKQATITGAATTITSSNLTTQRAVIANTSGKIAVSSVTSGELLFVSGVTSAIQTQFTNVRAVKSNVSVSSNVTLTNNAMHFVNTSAARTLTLPSPSATLYLYVKDVTGSAQTNNITINPASGTIDGAASLVVNANYAGVAIVSDGTNYFVV